jgi:cyanophycinase
MKRLFPAWADLMLLRSCLVAFAVLIVCEVCGADEGAKPSVPAPPARWVDPKGVPGPLVIVGGGDLPGAAVEVFLKEAGGEKAKLVVIPTASQSADEAGSREELIAEWKARGFAEVAVLHTRSKEEANAETFALPLTLASAVWFGGGDQSKIAEAYLGTRVESEIMALHRRGGVIGGTSAGAAIQSKCMITGGQEVATVAQGFDLLPGAVVDQHFLARNRQGRLKGVIDAQAGLFGVGIDEGTALLVKGRSMRVVGKSSVTIYHAASRDQAARELVLMSSPRQVADLPMYRREARQRAEGEFPLAAPKEPKVDSGSLVIVGGGGMPRDVTAKFIELAGGLDAPIVVLPTAVPDPKPSANDGALFTRAGAKNVKVFAENDWDEVHSAEFLEALKNAKGVWFGGGRQWHFLDAYEDSPAVELFRDVLKRGGVIGGSSAGATIQGDYLVRGSPYGPNVMIADGYETGMCFLPGVAIDQHFSQRGRAPDMEGLMRVFPQYLGIGLDETTAIIVQGTTAEVMGRNEVRFYHVPDPKAEKIEPSVLKAGGKFDLKERKIVAGG